MTAERCQSLSSSDVWLRNILRDLRQQIAFRFHGILRLRVTLPLYFIQKLFATELVTPNGFDNVYLLLWLIVVFFCLPFFVLVLVLVIGLLRIIF